jgi:hypothetical protein
MSKYTGPGQLDNIGGPRKLLLYNFDVDGDNLKPEHQAALRQMVVPRLSTGGSVAIIGLASRTGSYGHNQRLSERRARNVFSFLQANVPGGNFPVKGFTASGKQVSGPTGWGELKAKDEGERNGTEDRRFRAVCIVLGDGQRTPDPIGVFPDLKELSVDFSGGSLDTAAKVLDTAGKILDTISSAGGVVGLAVEAAMFEVVNTAIGVVATIIGLPGVWLSGNVLAQKNGFITGFSTAMEEMAAKFDDYDLRDLPENKWPAVPHPRPKFALPDSQVTVAERSANEGIRNGYEKAWLMITTMDKKPQEFTALLKGKKLSVKMSGRALLYLLQQKFRSDVKSQVRRIIEAKLNAK